MLKKILIIDDEPGWVELLKNRLERDYRVFTASDGDDGIRIAMNEKPDLILCDVMMPRVDGYRVIHELKKYFGTSHIPILLLTAVQHTQSIFKAQALGAADYVTKPVNFDELPKLIRRHI